MLQMSLLEKTHREIPEKIGKYLEQSLEESQQIFPKKNSSMNSRRISKQEIVGNLCRYSEKNLKGNSINDNWRYFCRNNMNKAWRIHQRNPREVRRGSLIVNRGNFWRNNSVIFFVRIKIGRIRDPRRNPGINWRNFWAKVPDEILRRGFEKQSLENTPLSRSIQWVILVQFIWNIPADISGYNPRWLLVEIPGKDQKFLEESQQQFFNLKMECL